MLNRKLNIFIVSSILILVALLTCHWIMTDNSGKELTTEVEDHDEISFEEEMRDFMRSINTIDAHLEEDTIVGNFTGIGLDTLYVIEVADSNRYMCKTYFLKSTNPEIPQIELVGIPDAPPKLVNEGDLDGNGTTEVGTLRTGVNGQWRSYDIFTLVNYEWCNLVEGEFLSTPQLFRDICEGVAEPGEKKGIVLIHYYHEEYDDVNEERIYEIRDTIVIPTFSKYKNPYEALDDSI